MTSETWTFRNEASSASVRIFSASSDLADAPRPPRCLRQRASSGVLR